MGGIRTSKDGVMGSIRTYVLSVGVISWSWLFLLAGGWVGIMVTHRPFLVLMMGSVSSTAG